MWRSPAPALRHSRQKTSSSKSKTAAQKTTDGTSKEFITDRHFNPDGIALLKEPSGEVSENVLGQTTTPHPSDMRGKFEAFIGYGQRFPKLIEIYARKYHSTFQR